MCVVLAFTWLASFGLEEHVAELEQHGQAPIGYVQSTLEQADLLIFDDGLHSALEPWQFYIQLIKTDVVARRLDFVFIEVLSISGQPHIDAFMDAATVQPDLLAPALQNDFSGCGWRYQTTVDLLLAVREANAKLPETQRIRVIGAANPTFWCDINNAADLALFRRSLLTFDYHLYQVILDAMDHFETRKKGFFLTNTRHAYKGIRKQDGSFFWNAGTFFAQWHPGKTRSIRCHNATLFISGEREANTQARTTSGMERLSYRWARIPFWDQAFATAKTTSIAMPLAHTVFGKAAYTGNHMHQAAPGQTMADANDAIIFLGALETLHSSAKTDLVDTPNFRQELKRRLVFLMTEKQLQAAMAERAVSNMDDYIALLVQPTPAKLASIQFDN